MITTEHVRGSDETRTLSLRELEVLELIAEGYSSGDIARALWISEETVRTHVRRILRRLGARTRAHAVAIAFREDLWTHPRPRLRR